MGFLPVNTGKNVIEICLEIVKNPGVKITVHGKNYYVESDDIILTINRYTFTKITAHNLQKQNCN